MSPTKLVILFFSATIVVSLLLKIVTAAEQQIVDAAQRNQKQLLVPDAIKVLHNGVAGILQNVIDESVFATTTTTTTTPVPPSLPPKRPLPPYHLYNTYPRPLPIAPSTIGSGYEDDELEKLNKITASLGQLGVRPVNRQPLGPKPKEEPTTSRPSSEDEDLTEEDDDEDHALLKLLSPAEE